MNIFKRILKYPLEVYDTPGLREIMVDCISITPLSAAEQHGELMLWTLVETNEDEAQNTPKTLSVEVVGTGWPLSYEVLNARFIGTVVMQSTAFVWHMFA